jgi:uncharacterized protein YfiM (DUF2279 family)
MKIIFSQDKWTGNDKVKHFLLCMAGALALFPTLYLGFGLSIIISILVTFIAAMAVGIGKELKDMPTTGFSYKDLAADAAGCLAGLIIMLIIALII